jgi:spermidine synthase
VWGVTRRRARQTLTVAEPTKDTPIGGRTSLLLVSVTSGLVLVLEILAGRLMAPYVGVSLDTFTGIIGTILAGIATGAAFGGGLADRKDPVRLIAQALFFGGGLTWLSIPIVSVLGPNLGSGPVAIVLLAACAFFLPAAALSGIGPMVAKLELESLDQTGSVIGRLSAASTFGALIGTFGTGFVLITFLPVRTIILIVGALLVLGGVIVFMKSGRTRPAGPEIAVVILAALISLVIGSPCDRTTDYYCIRIVADAESDPDGRPGGRSLFLDQLRNAHVDLDDPEYLDIRYMRIFADATESLEDGPIRVLHVGGGGFSLPRYISAVRPGSTNTVLELDDQLVEIATEHLGLTDADGLDILTGDARLHLADLPDAGFDLIVGDAYSGSSVPWHLTTVEVVREFDRLLDDNGLYIMNVIDGGDSRFSRAQLETLSEVFDELGIVEPTNGIPERAVNQILLASHNAISTLDIDPDDGRQLSAAATTDFIGDDAQLLTDNFAPADQLLP